MPPPLPSHVISSLVCLQTCQHNIWKATELVSMQIGTSGLRAKDMKRSTRSWGLKVEGQGHTRRDHCR